MTRVSEIWMELGSPLTSSKDESMASLNDGPTKKSIYVRVQHFQAQS